MSDEIEYNAFYNILQNRYHKKYELAISHCCVICVPRTEALRGIDITEHFVDLHVLKSSPHNKSFYQSTDEHHSHTYELLTHTLVLQQSPVLPDDKYVVNILSVEPGYNKDFHQYKIFIVDKPLSPLYAPKPPDDGVLQLGGNITSYHEAKEFLLQFVMQDDFLSQLDSDIQSLADSIPMQSQSARSVCAAIHELLSAQWGRLLHLQAMDIQRDARYQKMLTVALENYILHHLHQHVFPIVCRSLSDDDNAIVSRILELSAVGVTADQLGAPEDFAVPLPAAVVELASLDSRCSPSEKMACLRTTLDLILAELKGAIVDAQSMLPGTSQEDSQLPTFSTDDLIPLLMSVIIQAKPLHMASDLHYMETFQWSLSPNDALSFSLVTFRAAVQQLLSLHVHSLKPRSGKVLRELGLEELIKVTGEVCERNDRRGDHRHDGATAAGGVVSLLDRQLERVTAMIEASTRDLSDCERHKQQQQRPALVDLLSNLQANLGMYFSRQDHP